MIIYEINENVVVAKFAEDGLTLRDIWVGNLYESLTKHLNRMHFRLDSKIIAELIYNVLRERKLVGISKCNPCDEFNEYIGMDMAKNDLLRRYKKAETQLKLDFLSLLEKDINILTE